MTLSGAVVGFQWFFLLYFTALTSIYLLLNLISLVTALRYKNYRVLDELGILYSGLEIPITLIAPAYNEEATIASSVRSLLQLNYQEYEVVVVNDGSRDNTLKVLIEEFGLEPFPEAYRIRIQTQPVRAIYYSRRYPQLRVVDKENGGKADALNAGINCARYPLFCGMDADSILPRGSLLRIVRPFMEDPNTVAVGGVIRIINGSQVREGHLVKIALPRNWLALFQIIEYLRSFLFGRMGWQPLNAVLIISGAFGLFRTETVIAVGGYRSDTVGEDMELVVRMHRVLSGENRPYRVHFIPDPICWTEAPEDLRTLKNQRIRWQRGVADSLWFNRGLLFSRRSGAAGWLAYPFLFFFELFGPFIELMALVLVILAYFLNLLDSKAAIAFLVLAFGSGLLLSSAALFLEELFYRTYRRRYGDLLTLFLALIAENFGYRQLNSYWRMLGLFRWLFGKRASWGKMRRSAKWETGKLRQK